jgi:N-carbamoyl-L-amino-acid hydrolase
MISINAERLLADLAALGAIGRTPQGGVSRPALSAADVEGRAWFYHRVEAAGLTFQQDGAGNLSAILPGPAGAPTLLIGSHLDTVPNGGRYDGALGVLAALEVLRTVREAGLTLPVTLEAISFTDEEGTVMGLMGSSAVAGQLTTEDLTQARGGADALNAGLARIGTDRQSVLDAVRDPASLAGFVEVHVEQGTRLEEAGLQIGVVDAIVGIRSAWLRFHGRAAHAGTMPMSRRADALWGASAFIQQAKEVVMARFSPGVMNCGRIQVHPGAFNIVPAKVDLALEFRHGSEAQLDEMESVLLELAQSVAGAHGLTVETEVMVEGRSAPMHPTVLAAIEFAAARLGLGHTRLVSFAGHDTQALSVVTPSAMFFVPSVDGISHNPKEFTHPQDLINGTNVLLHTVLILAGDGK